MLKSAAIVLLVMMFFPFGSLSAGPGRQEGIAVNFAGKIRIVFGSQETIITMFDNPASKDFLTMLPLTAEFSDYVRTEKITTLPRKLDVKGTPTAREFSGSDFTYYAPWGNLAVFYNGFGTDSQLYVLGRIESGKDALARMSGNFTARIEKVE